MSHETDTSSGPSDQTRRALIDAAITLFGQNGFQGTSTRAIAQMADTNVASIAYHFGGKDGLHLACGVAIAERIAAAVGSTEMPEVETPDQAMDALERILTAFLHFLLLELGEADIVAFMMREMAEDGPAIREVYQTAIEPRHRGFCRLWEAATGWPAESDRTRLTVFSMIGQVLYFRIGRTIVQRRMGWERIDAAEVGEIAAVVTGNLRAVFNHNRRSEP